MQYKPPLELSHYPDHATQINSSIIWLHGLGADGHDFAPIAHYLLRPDAFPNTRFVLPHAPAMPVTRNNGYIMPAWYDVYGITPISKEDAAGIKQSQQYIEQLIDQEIKRGIPSNRIVLAGFSQGGAIALHCAIRYSRPLAAVLALSTYLPLKSSVGIEKNAANFQTPIFMAHGVYDDIIHLEMAQSSRDELVMQQYAVHWHEYPMAHSVSNEEIADIEQFLHQVLD